MLHDAKLTFTLHDANLALVWSSVRDLLLDTVLCVMLLLLLLLLVGPGESHDGLRQARGHNATAAVGGRGSEVVFSSRSC